jgi:hypothetical protein
MTRRLAQNDVDNVPIARRPGCHLPPAEGHTSVIDEISITPQIVNPIIPLAAPQVGREGDPTPNREVLLSPSSRPPAQSITANGVMLGNFESALTIGRPRTSAVATMMRSPGSAFAVLGTEVVG